MRSLSNLVILATTMACSLAAGQRGVAATRADRGTDDTTFYQVPLMCPAARGLGCGSRAKPVLLELERTPVVEEAWLDHTGQTLAVVWKGGSAPADRAATLAAVSETHSVAVDELSGGALDAALTDFRSGKGWHRGADVDRLSEEEARVIADRLLARLVTNAPTVKDKTESLRPVLTDGIRQALIGPCPSVSECREKAVTAARAHLNDAEISALRQAVGLGFRPIGNEQ